MFTWHGPAQRSRPPTLVTLESTSPLLPNAVRSPSIHPVAKPSSSRGSPEAAPWPRVTAKPGVGSAGVTRGRGMSGEVFFFFFFNYKPRWCDEQLSLWLEIQGDWESDFSNYSGKITKQTFHVTMCRRFKQGSIQNLSTSSVEEKKKSYKTCTFITPCVLISLMCRHSKRGRSINALMHEL